MCRMTSRDKQEYVAEMKRFTKEIIKDPQKCKDMLVRAGIYTKNGNLRKPYR